MKAKGKSKAERLKSAALVRLKYELLTGKMDKGFQSIYAGVLEDLSLTETEVNQFIEAHRKELEGICFGED
jgi:hypothetical protein